MGLLADSCQLPPPSDQDPGVLARPRLAHSPAAPHGLTFRLPYAYEHANLVVGIDPPTLAQILEKVLKSIKENIL